MLRTRALRVRLGGAIVLDGVDLDVDDGEVVVVLGPSGSGKTTLLRAIAGLDRDEGTVAWDDHDLTDTPPHRRRFGLMFQDHALFPHRDVLANVAFGLRMQHRSRIEVDERARAALARVGLTGFEHRSVHELSGGEQQRVALARALAPEPRLLMLDEPFGSLDRARRDDLVHEVSSLVRSLGLSTILVTHDHDEAFALADRVAVLEHGRLAQVATPADLWDHPANPFVAAFLGWNVIEADDGISAVRPDHLHVDPQGPIEAVVTGVAFRGDRYLVRAQSGDDRLTLIVAGTPPALGAAIRLRPETPRRYDLHEISTSRTRRPEAPSVS